MHPRPTRPGKHGPGGAGSTLRDRRDQGTLVDTHHDLAKRWRAVIIRELLDADIRNMSADKCVSFPNRLIDPERSPGRASPWILRTRRPAPGFSRFALAERPTSLYPQQEVRTLREPLRFRGSGTGSATPEG